MIEYRIDYLQFSATIEAIFSITSIEEFQKRSNIPFYESMTKYDNGIIRYDGNPNTEKSLYILTGSVCETLGVDELFCNQVLDEFHGKASRLDLAMTTDQSILALILKDKDKIISEMFQQIKIIADADFTPETIYIGDIKKRGKKGIVRAYDKGLQMGLEGVTRHRIEIELKRDQADLALKRIASGNSIQSVMNSKFRIDVEWYKLMFGEDIAINRFKDLTNVERKEIDKKMAWVEKQVIPSLRYIIDYDRDNNTQNFKRLMKRLGLDYETFDINSEIE